MGIGYQVNESFTTSSLNTVETLTLAVSIFLEKVSVKICYNVDRSNLSCSERLIIIQSWMYDM